MSCGPIGGRVPVNCGCDLAFLSVEVSGFEPPTSTLRKCGSRCFDQGLYYDLPGSGISIPSGSLTIPRLPAR
jgi:hypothetical protein